MIPLLLALGSAILSILVFPRFDLVWLAPLCLAPLLIAVSMEQRPWHRVWIGTAAGIVYWCGVCYWIAFVLENYAGLNKPVAWLTFFLFGVGKSIHWAAFAWLSGYIIHRPWALPAIAALWTGIERTNALTFVWLPLGNAGIDMGIPMRLAPLVGVYGLSFIFVMMNVAVAFLVLRRPRREIAWLLILPGLYLLPGLPDGDQPQHTAVVVQPNIKENQEWTVESTERTVRSLGMLSLEHASSSKVSPEIILWPEVPAPFYYSDPDFRKQVEELARVTKTSFLFGGVGFTPERRPLNSAFMLDSGGNYVARYDKVNLVPFGEFVPSIFWWIKKISGEAGNFEPGKERIVFPGRSGRIGAFICYESVFPHFVREFVAGGAGVLVNLSNDGYFGGLAAREQHLLVARMRAAENRRWLIRATNDGITATVDPAGRIANRVAPDKRLSAKMRFSYLSEKTPYTKYGDWFVWTCLVAGLLACLIGPRPS